MTDRTVEPAQSLRGELQLPGDKSISHRALLLAMLGAEPVRIENLAPGEDVISTALAVEALGARVERPDPQDTSIAVVTGRGMRGLALPDEPVDARNAGTLARLLPGILAGQSGSCTIIGDESLSVRPMARIASPLRSMGVDIELAAGDTLPMTVRGTGEPLTAIDHELQVASAQVQSSVLLAGLYADGPTTVHEPGVLRDHTERMLRRAGVRIARKGREVTVWPAERLQVPDVVVPCDPSSAAPFVIAATLLRGSLLRLPHVLLNPGRTGLFDTLTSMGARIGMANRAQRDGEPTGDLEVEFADLGRVNISWGEDVPRMIDELPLVGLLAQFLKGQTVIKGAAELRHKESDRITTTVTALRRIGVHAEELKDGFMVRGSGRRPDGGTIHAEGDHRIAMLGAVAGLVSRHGVKVEDAECVDVSFPGFFEIVERLAIR